MAHPDSPDRTNQNVSRVKLVILWILLLVAGTEFVVRGPARYLQSTGWNDLSQYYTASRLWLRGQSFAKAENFTGVLRDEMGATFSENTVRVRIAPPPGALVLFAPLGALSWRAAVIVWLGLLVASFAVTVWALVGISGRPFSDPHSIAFVAGCLALAPFHTGIAGGNQTILVVGLCSLAIWAASAECDMVAGLLFGTACSLKPHIGAFLVLYYLLRRRWRLFFTAVTLTAVLVLLAVAWMQFSGVHWFADYVSNISFGAAKNTIDDFTTANPIRFMLINLQVPFFSFTHNARSSNLLAFSVGGVLILFWMVLVLKSKKPVSELLILATIGCIGLLPLYHRFYDASVLAIALCWSLNHQGNKKKVANTALLLMVPFLIPGAAVLQQAARMALVPEAWFKSWWWDHLLMPHQTWLLLSLSFVLLYAMLQQSAQAEPEHSPSIADAIARPN